MGSSLRPWQSLESAHLQIHPKKFFRTTVEPILIYGCDSWSLTQTVEHVLGGTYTRMLRKTLNMSWRNYKNCTAPSHGSPPSWDNRVFVWQVMWCDMTMQPTKSCSGSPMALGEEVDQQQLCCKNTIEKDTNFSRTNLLTATSNRNHWKEIIRSPHQVDDISKTTWVVPFRTKTDLRWRGFGKYLGLSYALCLSVKHMLLFVRKIFTIKHIFAIFIHTLMRLNHRQERSHEIHA